MKRAVSIILSRQMKIEIRKSPLLKPQIQSAGDFRIFCLISKDTAGNRLTGLSWLCGKTVSHRRPMDHDKRRERTDPAFWQ